MTRWLCRKINIKLAFLGNDPWLRRPAIVLSCGAWRGRRGAAPMLSTLAEAIMWRLLYIAAALGEVSKNKSRIFLHRLASK